MYNLLCIDGIVDSIHALRRLKESLLSAKTTEKKLEDISRRFTVQNVVRTMI